MEICFHVGDETFNGTNQIMYITDLFGIEVWPTFPLRPYLWPYTSVNELFNSKRGFTDKFYERHKTVEG